MGGQIFRKTALERLSSPEELDSLLQVTTPKGWIALVALGGLVLAAVAWGAFGTLPVKVGCRGVLLASGTVRGPAGPAGGSVAPFRTLEALLFLDPAEGNEVRPGMKVLVTPLPAGRKERSSIVGRVVRVSAVTTDEREMLRGLGSGNGPQGLPDASPARAVRVELRQDRTTGNGYAWASGSGRSMKLESGMACAASVIVGEISPIALVLPYAGSGGNKGSKGR